MKMKTYEVNGKPVQVCTGSIVCLKCGRRLTDPHSQAIGYGPECAPRGNNNYREMVILAIGGEVPQKVREDKDHPIIYLIKANHEIQPKA